MFFLAYNYKFDVFLDTHTFSFVFFSLTLFQLGDSCGTWSMHTSSLLSHVPFSLLRVWFLIGSQTARSHTIGFQCGFSTIFSIDYKLLRLTYHSRENFAIRTFSTIFRIWSVFPSMLFSSVSIEIIFFSIHFSLLVFRWIFSNGEFFVGMEILPQNNHKSWNFRLIQFHRSQIMFFFLHNLIQ